MGSSQGLAWGLEAMGIDGPGVLETAHGDPGGRRAPGSGRWARGCQVS